MVAAAGVVCLRILAYNRILGYDPKADYEYQFAQGTKVNVRLSKEGFVFPKLQQRWDSGFLKLRLAATLSGALVDPVVQVKHRSACVRQYLERGGRGIRYINISALAGEPPAPGDRVVLQGHHVAWAEQDATLVLFDNARLDRARILVVSAHPDDAEIAAFGLYSHRDAYIATVTAGDAGAFTYRRFLPDEKQHSLTKGRLRAWDSVTVPLWGGIPPSRCVNMGYFDGMLSTMFQLQGKPVSAEWSGISDVSFFRQFNQSDLLPKEPRDATWPNLVGDFVRILDRVRPSLIVTAHPMLDSHPDHQFSSIAVLQALSKTKLTRGRLYFYINHHMVSEFHPVGHIDGVVSLPPNPDGVSCREAVFSYTLTHQEHIDKIFALEMMHALRPPPEMCAQKPKAVEQALDALKNLIRGAGDDAFSHTRRSARPNELFFVAPFDHAKALAARFLATMPRRDAAD